VRTGRVLDGNLRAVRALVVARARRGRVGASERMWACTYPRLIEGSPAGRQMRLD